MNRLIQLNRQLRGIFSTSMQKNSSSIERTRDITLFPMSTLRKSSNNPTFANFSSATNSELIINQSANGCCHVKLNRSKSLNSLTDKMITQMNGILDQLDKSKEMKILLLTGEGKHFCAGGDVVQASQGDVDYNRRFFTMEYQMNYKISNLKKPYISVWKNVVMGGGVGISIYGSYRIATCDTKFAMPETGIGLFPDVGASFFLGKLGRGVGLYLGLTGHILTAQDLINLQLATHYIPQSKLDEFIHDLGNCSFPDVNNQESCIQYHSIVREIINRYACYPQVETTISEEDFSKIDHYFSNDSSLKDIMAKLLKDSNEDKWCFKTYNTIRDRCPLSCVTWFKLLQVTKNLPLAECLKYDTNLALSFTTIDPNFREGVRAILIDKTKDPSWIPKTIEEVQDETVEKLFKYHSYESKL